MEMEYLPYSSGSETESGVPISLRLRSSQMSIDSQSGDTDDRASQPLNPTTNKSSDRHCKSPASAKKIAQSRKRKRHFHGNRFSKQAIEVPATTSLDSAASRKLLFSPIPKLEKHSVSIRTATLGEHDISVGTTVGNCVVSYSVLQEMFDMSVCKECLVGRMKILDTQTRCGCASYILLTCENCRISKQFWSVHGKFREEIPIGTKSIPKRNELVYGAVLGARLSGIGSTRAALYHACLGIRPPGNKRTFTEVQRHLIIAAKKIANDTMDNARDEIRLLQGSPLEYPFVRAVISFDGAYQMRTGKSGGGFSRYCFAAAICISTAKVISYGIASNSCKLCVEYESRKRTNTISPEDYEALALKHAPVCTAKYSDYASVQLESAVAPSIVSQALDRGVVFSGIVTDGDNKTFEALKKANLYEDLNVDKIEHMECLSHVVKRLKINLCKRQERILKSSRTSKAVAKNCDSVTSLPINNLSDSMAGVIASYYRMAVKRNAGNIDAIIESVNAIPLHLGATDVNAAENHRNCPKHPDSWCRYQRAISLAEPIPHHPNFLTQSVVDLIMDVFSSFGYNSPDFVRKIEDGLTSNHNEALHSVLWSMVHKNEPVNYEIMELGSALSVIRYNEGYNGILKLFSSIGVNTTAQLTTLLQEFDNKRILKSSNIILQQQKRFAKKQLRGKNVKSQLRKHGEGYSSGKYSGAQKAPSSDSGDEVDTQATTNPTEVTGPLQPQMYMCAGRSTNQPIRFQDSGFFESGKPVLRCAVCIGTEENRLVGIGLQTSFPRKDINWIHCEICEKCFHHQCVDEDLEELDLSFGWICPDC